MFARILPALFVLGVLPALAADPLPAGVAARMGDVEIRLDELRVLLDGLTPEQRTQLARNPADLQRVVRTEALRRLMVAEARTKGWDKRAEVVSLMERFREQALASSYLASVTRPPEGFPSEAEIKAAYDQNQAGFTVPKQYLLSQIYVLAPPESDKLAFDKARAKAADMAAKAKARGADFSALARANSEHSESAVRGGDMGWLSEANLLPELRDAVAALKKGEAAGPVKSSQGWHVFRLEDSRDKSVRPFAEVRDQIVVALRQRKAQETEQAYLNFVANKNPINLNSGEITRLLEGPAR